MPFSAIFLFSCFLGSHILHYYISMTSSPTQGVPQYSITGHIDDLLCIKYNGDKGLAQFLIPSLNVLTEYLEYQTTFAQRWEVYQERKMKFLMGLLNKTAGECSNGMGGREFSKVLLGKLL